MQPVESIIVMPVAPSLTTIGKRFRQLTAGLDALPSYKRFATVPTHDGAPHAERNGSVFAYVVTERGQEYERRETSDPDELLYWFVSDVAWAAAQRFELNHRQRGMDFRRLLFQKHVALLSELRPEWGRRKQSEYDVVLRRVPFKDGA
jgi:hypothetical protein